MSGPRFTTKSTETTNRFFGVTPRKLGSCSVCSVTSVVNDVFVRRPLPSDRIVTLRALSGVSTVRQTSHQA
jgi:hypothetical protein